MTTTFGLNEMSKHLLSIRDKNIDVPKHVYSDIPKALCDEMSRVLFRGGKIRLERIGVIEVKIVAPRKRRNPKTGEVFLMSERKSVKFKASKHVCRLLNMENKKSKKKLSKPH